MATALGEISMFPRNGLTFWKGIWDVRIGFRKGSGGVLGGEGGSCRG